MSFWSGLSSGFGKDIWDSITGGDKERKANDALHDSINQTKGTTDQINKNYQDLLNQYNQYGGIGSILGNQNNLGKMLMDSFSGFLGGANSDYVKNQQGQVNTAFDKAKENQAASMANMGFNPNDKAYNNANSSLENQRANALSAVSERANQQAFNNFLQGAGMYGNLQNSLLNTGLGINNSWASALTNGLNANIGANNALGASYDNQANNRMNMFGSLIKALPSLAGMF